MIRSVKAIERRLHEVIQERLQVGWCLKSTASGGTGFAFMDTEPSAGGNNTACGCLVGVICGDTATDPLGEVDGHRGVASRNTSVTVADLCEIERGFEGRRMGAVTLRSAKLYALGASIRETYNA